jgi:hypothetical protein
MFQKGVIALLLVLGAAAWSPAQPYRWTGPGRPPRRPAPELQGRWYFAGDPDQPCYIDVDPDGRHVTITNERGDETEGRIIGRGRIFAPGWGRRGLEGTVEGDTLYWSNGSEWIR